MVETLRNAWRKWRESSRRYKLDRALYKAGGGTGPSRPARGTIYGPTAGHASREADSVAQADSEGREGSDSLSRR